jgi:toxin FitB
MPSYLLDTNVLSELVRPQPAPAVVSFVSETTGLWLSAVVLHELAFGAASVVDSSRRLRLEAWHSAVKYRYKGRIIGIDETIAEMAWRLRGYVSTLGRTLGPLDALLAATALTRSHVLATRNIRDFAYLDMKLYDPWKPEGTARQ